MDIFGNHPDDPYCLLHYQPACFKKIMAAAIAYDYIEKLSRLNRSLLLLAKIENNQFATTEQFDLRKVIDEKVSSFQELWLTKQIKASCFLDNAFVSMNKELADILMN